MCALLNGTLTGFTYYPHSSILKVDPSITSFNYRNTPYDYHQYDGSTLFDYADAMGGPAYQLADGSIFMFSDDTKNCVFDNHTHEYDNKKCGGIIDVNGLNGPNKIIKCSYTTTRDIFDQTYEHEQQSIRLSRDAPHRLELSQLPQK